jgi:hypothetical protein
MEDESEKNPMEASISVLIRTTEDLMGHKPEFDLRELHSHYKKWYLSVMAQLCCRHWMGSSLSVKFTYCHKLDNLQQHKVSLKF